MGHVRCEKAACVGMPRKMIDSFDDERQNEAMEINPYAAPQSQVLQATSEDELTRRSHINTEATIKSVGILYYLGALALTLVGGSALASGNPGRGVDDLAIGVIILILGIGLVYALPWLKRQSGGRVRYALIPLFLWAVATLSAQSFSPFLYFQF